MAYEQQREDLSEGIASTLFSLVKKKEYPIHPGVGLWGFTQGLHNSGVQVDFNTKAKKAKFHFNIVFGGIKYYAPVEREYSHIIAGSKSVPGSLGAYADSLCDLFFSSHNSIEDAYGIEFTDEQEKEVIDYFNKQCTKFVDAMNVTWQEYFRKYHENCLVSVDGTVPVLGESSLLPVVLDDLNLSDYEEICREDLDVSGEKRDFCHFINESFLIELASVKGYAIQSIDPKKIKYDPLDVLAHGKNIFWRNLERLLD
jgi:hypothetical protein